MSAPLPNEVMTREVLINYYEDGTLSVQLCRTRLSYHHLGWLAGLYDVMSILLDNTSTGQFVSLCKTRRSQSRSRQAASYWLSNGELGSIWQNELQPVFVLDLVCQDVVIRE